MSKKTIKQKIDTKIEECPIPLEDRCSDFEKMWNMIYKQVISEWYEVQDIRDIMPVQRADNQ